MTNREQALVDELRKAYAEITELKAERFHRFNEEDCWIYLDGEDNHLESLVCPVVITAEKLIALGA
jgi:hypothetical protein